MSLVEGIVFVGFESQVELLVSQVIRFFAVAHPGEFQRESGTSVSQINDLVAAVRCVLFADNGKIKCFLIKCDAFFPDSER